VPKRHIPTWEDVTPAERSALVAAIDEARLLLCKRYSPDGFNVGFNEGAAGGQTVAHFHIHVIPRRMGDVTDPRGGIRHVIPSKGYYQAAAAPPRADITGPPHDRALIAGGEDALIQHVLPHLDQSHSVDIVVSFSLDSGVRLLSSRLQELLDRGGRLRIITGDYLDVTDPPALRRLLDLQGAVQRWVFETDLVSFHPKSWIFHFAGGGGVAIVGSSNLSETALRSGIEWNYRVYNDSKAKGWSHVVEGFESLLKREEIKTLTHDWIDAYESRRQVDNERRGLAEAAPEPPLSPPFPHPIQQQALRALKETRSAGFTAGLVVLATGLGKTWLSAFDSEPFSKLLFVAHREEILSQAMATFRRVRPAGRFGLYTGEQKDLTADVLFASIQTLGRTAHLQHFAPSAFDYIVVDEFHHAAAPTYRTLLQHFTPKFLLGLTATPERTDGGDLLGLCQENLVFRCDLFAGIEEQLLAPFHYFGVPDDVDYAQIPWRSTAFDEEALTRALATQRRAQNALEQYRLRGGTKAIGFCCSIVHADFMAAFFGDRGLRAAAIHSGLSSAPRVTTLEQLQSGLLDIVFAVDILNEGVDLPSVDAILMLRPTESSIVWLQQFGRGLRLFEGKTHLNVVDYIGNHRTFLTKTRTLLNAGEGDRALAIALEEVSQGQRNFPPGCEVTYDLRALDLLKQLLSSTEKGDALEAFYLDFRERHGVRPTALEVFHVGFDPRRTGHGDWFDFVEQKGDLTSKESEAFRRHEAFFNALATTRMVKSYKMLLLDAMLAENALPGSVGLDALTQQFTKMAARNPRFRADISAPLDELGEVRRLLIENPIAAWTGGKGTGGKAYFNFDGSAFSTAFDVSQTLIEAFQKLVAEILQFRIGQYLTGLLDLSQPEEGTDAQEATVTIGKLRLWSDYLRRDIAGLFGAHFNTGSWNRGMVLMGQDLILLLTLKKGDLATGNQYEDHFLDAQTLQWHTQSQTTRLSKHGRILSGSEKGHRVHLFVRPSKLRNVTAAPFTYCGELSVLDMQGEKPIIVTSKLEEPVPQRLRRAFYINETQARRQ